MSITIDRLNKEQTIIGIVDAVALAARCRLDDPDWIYEVKSFGPAMCWIAVYDGDGELLGCL